MSANEHLESSTDTVRRAVPLLAFGSAICLLIANIVPEYTLVFWTAGVLQISFALMLLIWHHLLQRRS